MRIVIDMQGAQSESRFNGIGRYTLALAQAIVQNRGEHEVILALSGLFPDTIESIRAAFDDQLLQEDIRVWYALGPVRSCAPDNEWRRKVAERIREAFLVNLQPDVVYIPSFFEGYSDDGVISIGVFTSNLLTVVALHDAHTGIGDENPYWINHNLLKMQYLGLSHGYCVVPPLVIENVTKRYEICREQLIESKLNNGFESIEDFRYEALQLIDHLKTLVEKSGFKKDHNINYLHNRKRLAYVSPLPPERTGIADYSSQLLPELSRFYKIDVVVNQDQIADPWINENCGVRSVSWFQENANIFDRVLYHFGNSPFHQHMLSLVEEIPGTVVFHDFFLGHLQAFQDLHHGETNYKSKTLYFCHGYAAVRDFYLAKDAEDINFKYPVNLSVFQNAQGAIVHSQATCKLANAWYGERFAAPIKTIPMVRVTQLEKEFGEERQILEISDTQFIVCCFGAIGSNKLNHRILEAWLISRLAKDPLAQLIFVGECHGGVYGSDLMQVVNKSGLKNRIHITGWVDHSTYQKYLAAANLAVQLRTLSRGETSAAVLDCLNYGLPTIVNANGSFAELPKDAVWMLPDEFTNNQLVEALETLWQDKSHRLLLGKHGRELILNQHTPKIGARQCTEAIEYCYGFAQYGTHALVKSISSIDDYNPNDHDCAELAQMIAESFPVRLRARQILIDVSAISRQDLGTGIQRVVRALTLEMLDSPPCGCRIEPIYLTDEGGRWHYRYARKWTSSLLGFSCDLIPPDEPVEFLNTDLILIADFTGDYAVKGAEAGLFQKLKNLGVELHFIVYDLLPIVMPQFFPPGGFGFEQWLSTISRVADCMICISQSVADELQEWFKANSHERLLPCRIDWFHLGADVQKSIPSYGLPENAEKMLSRLANTPSFLMVGTIEPRKGYLQVIGAFTLLWQQGFDINLVIVGREGWTHLPTELKRTIPEIKDRLNCHLELGNHLFWLNGISDQYLEKIYANTSCLIAASEGEGFGLPLIEAAQHKLPLIVRDIPVFREVAGEHAAYFSGKEPRQLAEAIAHWLTSYELGTHPSSHAMPWLHWKESTKSLLCKIINLEC